MTSPAHWRDFGPGIYLHIPFCRRRCGYCDFASATADGAARAEYVDDLCAEIRLAAGSAEPRPAVFRTIFLGGGTPTLLEAEQLRRILEAVRAVFPVAADAEVTMEANPESLDRPRLEAFLRAGGNRVSMGVQSLDDAALGLLGRLHDAGQARRQARALRDGGVPFSVDLIYGIPGLGLAAWRATLDAALDLGADHLSAYLLTLEPGTPMHAAAQNREIRLPADEEVRAQYEILTERAAAAGLACYEISNFARPGRESRHNQNYWVRGEYLGLGPSAHSHGGGFRWSNQSDPQRWSAAVRAGRRPVVSREPVGRQEAAEEWIFLGLRRAEGVPWALLAEAAGAGAASLEKRVGALAGRGLLERRDGWLRLAPEGRFVSDALFADLMLAMEETVPVGGRQG